MSQEKKKEQHSGFIYYSVVDLCHFSLFGFLLQTGEECMKGRSTSIDLYLSVTLLHEQQTLVCTSLDTHMILFEAAL